MHMKLSCLWILSFLICSSLAYPAFNLDCVVENKSFSVIRNGEILSHFDIDELSPSLNATPLIAINESTSRVLCSLRPNIGSNAVLYRNFTAEYTSKSIFYPRSPLMEFSDNFSESSTPVSFTVETQCINEGNSLLQIHFEASEPPQQEWFDYSVLFARDCPWPMPEVSHVYPFLVLFLIVVDVVLFAVIAVIKGRNPLVKPVLDEEDEEEEMTE